MLWAAIFPSIDFATNSGREIVRRSVEEYVSLVDQHPNVVRFFVQGRFPEQSEDNANLERGPGNYADVRRNVQ
jgi:hypothetical protein